MVSVSVDPTRFLVLLVSRPPVNSPRRSYAPLNGSIPRMKDVVVLYMVNTSDRLFGCTRLSS